MFWTAIPTVLLLGLVGYSFVVLRENEKKPANEIKIGVTGQQFVWTYQYPRALTGGAPLNSYDLYIPRNESVQFQIHSRDVIHAFWVPAFRLQEDAVPGITTQWRVTATRLGTYPVICNLLCGAGHSLMRSAVHVVTPDAVPGVAQKPGRRRDEQHGGRCPCRGAGWIMLAPSMPSRRCTGRSRWPLS